MILSHCHVSFNDIIHHQNNPSYFGFRVVIHHHEISQSQLLLGMTIRNSHCNHFICLTLMYNFQMILSHCHVFFNDIIHQLFGLFQKMVGLGRKSKIHSIRHKRKA